MRSSFLQLLAFAALSARLSLSQTLIPNNIPVCGQQCPLLIQAQQSCVPPVAPQSNQQAYASCFCQFGPLAPMYGGTITGFCPACSADDMSATQNWFKGFCPNQGKGAVGGAVTTTSATSSTSIANAATAKTSTPSSGGTKGSTISAQKGGPSGSWIKTHWRWVMMVVILFFGLGVLAFLFWFFHRRYHRKKAAEVRRLAGTRSDLDTWGPAQSAHDIASPTVIGTPTMQSEKGKERDSGANFGSAQEPPKQGRRMRESMRKSKRTSKLRRAFL